MKRITAEWIRHGELDWVAAGDLALAMHPTYEAICFHCQQCAEKYLKALMEELSISIPRTHNLKDVLASLSSHHKSLRKLRRGLAFLTRFAVLTRYPGGRATKREATTALRWAERIRLECRKLLGLKPPRSRRKSK